MIVYMSIPTGFSRSRTKVLPSINTIAGYICDDCLKEYGWDNCEIKETSLKNLLHIETIERWDETLGEFISGLHLCRSHSLKRRWQTKQYRQTVENTLIPILKSKEFRNKLTKHGRYANMEERINQKLNLVISQIINEWHQGTLDFKATILKNSNILAKRLNISGKTLSIGRYRYKPSFEKWLSQELQIPQSIVHKRLFKIWLNKIDAPDLFNAYKVWVNGTVKGTYHRHHGYVIHIDTGISITFASSIELSFIIDCILKEFIPIQSLLNNRNFAIPYNYRGTTKNYYPDFLVHNDTIVEVKDNREANLPIHQSKWNALQQFATLKGYTPMRITEKDISQKALDLSSTLCSITPNNL